MVGRIFQQHFHTPLAREYLNLLEGGERGIDPALLVLRIDHSEVLDQVAETVPFRYLIQHFGMVDAEYEERRIDAAFSSLEEIKIFAGQRGVEVLLENTPNHFSSAERLLNFLEITHLD